MKRFVNWTARSQHLIEVLAISVWSVLSLETSDLAFAQKGFAGCLPVSERSGEIGGPLSKQRTLPYPTSFLYCSVRTLRSNGEPTEPTANALTI